MIRLDGHRDLVTSVRIAYRHNKIVLALKLLPSRAFPLHGRSTGLMPERRLAEIIELQHKYVYLFKTEKWFVEEPVSFGSFCKFL